MTTRNDRTPTTEHHRLRDDASGLVGTISFHSFDGMTCIGGIRIGKFGDVGASRPETDRLAERSAYRNAIADLPLGGAAVMVDAVRTGRDRAAMMQALGRSIDGIQRTFATTSDMGMSAADLRRVAATSGRVAGLPPARGRPGGDPSPWTALGVFLSMRFMAETQLHRRLRDCTVAIQGVGRTGGHLARLLHREGVPLVIADVDPATVSRVVGATGADVAPAESILSVRADILAPCAMGGILSERTIHRLGASLVCGAADGQLATPEDGARLSDAGIPYAPDYVVNAGGAINVAAEMLGWTEGEAIQRICSTPQRLDAVLGLASVQGRSPGEMADDLARQMMSAVAAAEQGAAG